MKIGVNRAEKLAETADAVQTALDEVQSALGELADGELDDDEREDASELYLESLKELRDSVGRFRGR